MLSDFLNQQQEICEIEGTDFQSCNNYLWEQNLMWEGVMSKLGGRMKILQYNIYWNIELLPAITICSVGLISFQQGNRKLNSMADRTHWLLVLLLPLVLVHSSNVIILNRGCKQFDSAGLCLACSTRFYKDKEGICQPVNNNCKTYDSTNGACTSCYDGFGIVQDVCLPRLDSNDLSGILGGLANCNQLGDNGTCKKCSIGFYFDANKNCKKIPDTCASFNTNLGRCTGCYQGYALNANNQCALSTQTVADPGCNKFENGKCINCSFGYYFDVNRQCKIIPASCQNFDTSAFKCTACYPGYVLDSANNCVQGAVEPIDPGCARFEGGKCTKCSFGYYFNKQNKCRMIPPTCSNFNTDAEVCQSCYPGYALNNDKNCVQTVQTAPIDAGCSRFENGKCVKCSFGYYFGRQGTCKMIPSTCGNFDTMREVCQACYPGYVLDKDSNCVVGTSAVSDPGCNSFENGKCVKCSFGYYFDKNRACKLVPPTCRDYDTSKETCSSCYPGYTLNQNKQCQESAPAIIDSGCSKFENGVCTKCSFGFYFNKNKVCKSVPSTCSNFDTTKEECSACYSGYILDAKKNCVESASTVGDLGCSKFDLGKCIACSSGYYFNAQGICQQIPTTCSKFDSLAGVCRACYLGYELNAKNECVVSQQGVSDPNCRQFKNGKCTQCSAGAFFNFQGICVLSDPLCKTIDSNTQKCKECYPGYALDSVKLTCIEAPASAGDPNCRSFVNNECVECSFRFFKGSDGLCKSVDPNCRLYNTKSGQCSGCYDGYKLNGKKCEKDESGVSDPYCAEWKNGKCSRCSFGSFFGANGLCTTIDPLCQTWNEVNGACKSCYPSFELNNGKCVVSNNKDNFDVNCAKFSNKGDCTQCSRGFYFNAKNVCTQVDPLCANFDSKTVSCLGCYAGYKLSNGKCVEDVQGISDLNCAELKNSVCTKCSQGFYFDQNNKCKSINPQCRFFDTNSKKCGDCYPGYVLLNNDCVVGTKNNLCAEWKEGICLRCVVRAYFNDEGGCNEVSEYCNTYNLFDGSCQSCYGGFELSNGKCVAQKESNGCISYSKDQKCLQCEKRRYLNNQKCQKIDDLCDEFNFQTKRCTRCYSGYTLADDKCIVAQVGTDSEIENCFTYSLSGACIECFDRYYLKNNSCNQVNVFCKKYNATNGDCTDCYTGFKLDGAKCSRK